MPQFLTKLILLLCASYISGCGTFNNLSSSISPTGKKPYEAPRLVYGGTVWSATEGWNHLSEPQTVTHSATGAYLMAVDTPLSLIADTLSLPITVPAAIDRAVTDFYHLEDQ